MLTWFEYGDSLIWLSLYFCEKRYSYAIEQMATYRGRGYFLTNSMPL